MNKPGKWHVVLNIILVTLSFFGCLSLGYILSVLLFQWTGKPTEFISYLISAVIGVFLFSGVAKLASEIVSHTKYGQELDLTRHRFLENTLEALNKISRGDFNISIAIHEHDPFSEVAESVNKMARELSSMESQRQDFISNVSHEIQSPLTSIKGFAALLQNDDLPSGERRRYAAIIEAESSRLSSLSDNLLKLSALDGEKKPLNLREYRLDRQLSQIILSLEPQWSEKNIIFDVDLPKYTLSADEDLLSQVWVNLLHNAIKFTPDGGKITVGLSGDAVTIADSGIGIAQSDLMRIFERFYKADKARDRALGGNGLGLSLVKRIVELHGFHITVESEINKGTQFTIRLS
jgi:Signal transduction histidine kinase